MLAVYTGEVRSLSLRLILEVIATAKRCLSPLMRGAYQPKYVPPPDNVRVMSFLSYDWSTRYTVTSGTIARESLIFQLGLRHVGYEDPSLISKQATMEALLLSQPDTDYKRQSKRFVYCKSGTMVPLRLRMCVKGSKRANKNQV